MSRRCKRALGGPELNTILRRSQTAIRAQNYIFGIYVTALRGLKEIFGDLKSPGSHKNKRPKRALEATEIGEFERALDISRGAWRSCLTSNEMDK